MYNIDGRMIMDKSDNPKSVFRRYVVQRYVGRGSVEETRLTSHPTILYQLTAGSLFIRHLKAFAVMTEGLRVNITGNAENDPTQLAQPRLNEIYRMAQLCGGELVLLCPLAFNRIRSPGCRDTTTPNEPLDPKRISNTCHMINRHYGVHLTTENQYAFPMVIGFDRGKNGITPIVIGHDFVITQTQSGPSDQTYDIRTDDSFIRALTPHNNLRFF